MKNQLFSFMRSDKKRMMTVSDQDPWSPAPIDTMNLNMSVWQSLYTSSLKASAMF